MKRDKLLLATKTFIPNDAYPLREQPWILISQRNKKEWMAKIMVKMIKLEP